MQVGAVRTGGPLHETVSNYNMISSKKAVNRKNIGSLQMLPGAHNNQIHCSQ